MRFKVVAVGRIKEAPIRTAVDAYAKRLGHYAPVVEVEIKDGTPQQVSQAIAKALSPRDYVVALTIDGTMRSSEELAARLEVLANRAVDVAFLIGGADGLPGEVVKNAGETLSFSRMTFPHRIARLMLMEQLYRAMTIRKGEPYHHG
jgi:23S rRNA (pseudouridine1915-N3)-methyltransferase